MKIMIKWFIGLSAFIFGSMWLIIHSAQLNINVGTTANDGTGDSLRLAMQKTQTNFNNLFTNAAFTMITNDTTVALNTKFTNGLRRARVSAGVILTNTAADAAEVELVVTTTTQTNRFGPVRSYGPASTNTVQLIGWLNAGAVWWFTNLSAGSANAALDTNHFQLVVE